MNKVQKQFLTCCGVLPTLADYLEDCLEAGVFNRQTKLTTQNIVAQIRKLDNLCMAGASIEVIDQQNEIALAFRQWDSNNYKDGDTI